MPLNAEHGKKSIKLAVYFFTTGLNTPKLCFDDGRVYVMANKAHGIRSDNIGEATHRFKGLNGLLPAIKEALTSANINVIDHTWPHGRNVRVLLNLE